NTMNCLLLSYKLPKLGNCTRSVASLHRERRFTGKTRNTSRQIPRYLVRGSLTDIQGLGPNLALTQVVTAPKFPPYIVTAEGPNIRQDNTWNLDADEYDRIW